MTLRDRHIVLIEDDEIMGASLVQRLELEGAVVTWVKQMARGIPAVRTPRRPVDAAVCDIRLPDGSGEELFAELCRTTTPPPFLFITGQGDIDQAVRLLHAGAADYLTKPFDTADFLDRLQKIIRADGEGEFPAETGITPAARHVDEMAREFAKGDEPVLIRAARGLGKAGLARRMHRESDRSAAPFVILDEGRERDDAAALARAIEAAGEGTLYIPGLDSLSEAAQAVLVTAVRGGAPCALIATLGPEGDDGAAPAGVRDDLLSVLLAREIVIPPLQDRPDDAVWLATQFFQTLNARRPTPLRGISAHAAAALRAHDWPGNGRELRARMTRAVDAATGEWLMPGDIFPEMIAESERFATLAEAREAAERRHILAALSRTEGHVGQAARILRISRTTLWEKMQRLGLSEDDD